MDRTEILEKVMDANGWDYQQEKCIEECAELIQAIAKIKCYMSKHEGDYTNELFENLVDELADVRITTCEITMMFDCEDEVNERIDYKLRRLDKRLGRVEKQCVDMN